MDNVNDLDIPPFLRVTPEEAERRRKWWDANPPTEPTMVLIRQEDDEVAAKIRRDLEARKALRREIAKEKRSVPKVDTLGKRWNTQTSKWELDPTQEINMGKIKIYGYDKDMQRVDRACTSAKLPDEVPSKVVHAFTRGGKAVTTVSATNEDGTMFGAWTRSDEGQAVQNNAVYLTPAPSEPRKVRTKTASASPASAETVVKLPDAVDSVSKDKPMAKKRKAGSKGNGVARGPGVIATIVETISRASGASVAEIIEVLKKKFPERKVKAMTTTIKIQAPRNATTTEKSDKRGLVYYCK